MFEEPVQPGVEAVSSPNGGFIQAKPDQGSDRLLAVITPPGRNEGLSILRVSDIQIERAAKRVKDVPGVYHSSDLPGVSQ